MSLVLNVEILGEFKKLTAATQGAQNSLSGLQKRASSVARGIGRVVGALGLTLGFSAMVRGFNDATKAAEDARVANERIDAIAKSMDEFGNQTAQVTKRIKDYADSQEFMLGVDADVIKATQAKLLTFRNLTRTAGDLGGSFDRATKAAIDMAAAGFGSAESNATQLGKALNDPIKGITALNRAGIQFTEDQKALIESLVESGRVLEAQDLILAEIESQVGGTAAATATASQRMTLAFGAIQEEVGKVLLPMLNRLSAWMVETVPKVQKFFAELTNPTTVMGASWGRMIGTLDNTGAAFGRLMATISGSAPQQSTLMDWVTTLTAGLGQIVFFLDKAIQGFQALLSFNFSQLGSIIGDYGTDYNRFVQGQNMAMAPRLTAGQQAAAVQSDKKNVTININKGNVTAKEIATAVNKSTKTSGAPILTGTALRSALRN
jgi:hypothetical protein